MRTLAEYHEPALEGYVAAEIEPGFGEGKRDTPAT
jgi:hypothetical protein